MNKKTPFDIRSFFKRFPRFYYFVAAAFGPVLFTGLGARAFLRAYPTEGRVLNIGSGPRTYAHPNITNIDVTPYPGVALVAPAEAVPLPDGCAERIISDNVLEHVTDPNAAVREMNRLLAPSGIAYVSTPFLYPFHASPGDYQRWTRAGLEKLFGDFDILDIGVRCGPFSALSAFLAHFIGATLSFGSRGLQSVLTNLSFIPLFPLKFLDLIFAFTPASDDVASVFYCVVRKR